jgi:hypothetical protein
VKIGLVLGGRIPTEAEPFLTEIERCFPGALKDAVITVRKPKAKAAHLANRSSKPRAKRYRNVRRT